ncbi:tRNA adenosine deaminase-associated protein [uncultured Propionibacterium sp.]|uniref:tRNA adenosine deaminase-associated protein n=1 Tax=uncultured Propionibacterium sp. TaxID=218066 RepID=UPI00292EEE77|nr:tRNA adenosine deaminase-associated protein [uncultured Propionibacterium sp.]
MADDMTREFDDDEDVEELDSLDDREDADRGVISDDYDDLEDEEDDYDPDDDDDDEGDDYEDATADEIDFVAALYREDGAPVVMPLPDACANDLDELIAQLRRLPGDTGATGIVSVNGEFFVICRCRGRQVQVLLSDSLSSNDWPLARDVIDYLGLDVPDDDEEEDSESVGDLDILADQGVSEFDMENILDDLDEDSGELAHRIIAKIKFGPQFDRVIRS